MEIKSPYIVELADTLDHHWYHVWRKKGDAKGKYLGVFASATTILNAYPQSAQLTKWIAEQGFSEAQEIKSEKGRQGTKIHDSIEALFKGAELTRASGYKIEEWYKIDAFARWYSEYKPKVLALELPVFSKALKVPGRLDLLAEIDGKHYIIDYKSSASLHKHFPLQFSVYADAVEEFCGFKIDATAALHLGARNKDKYTFKEWANWREDHLPVFKSVYTTWVYDNKKQNDKTVEAPVLVLPERIKLEL